MKNKILKTKLVDWKKLELFQPSNLKKMSESQKNKLKESFKKNGFKSPFYVWETENKIYCIDGHTRIPILKLLEDEGENIPKMLPANFIDCKNKQEAKKAVLIYNSHYADIQQEEMFDWIKDLNVDEIINEIDMKIDIKNFNEIDRRYIDNIDISYEIRIECKDEEEQEKIFNKLNKEGIKCRILTL